MGALKMSPPDKEGTFSDAQGREIKTFRWTPVGEARALVFLCHGYGERLAPYYNEVALAGCERGLLCFGHDHPGHGQSGGERVQVSSIDEYVDPVLAHCRKMKEELPTLPLYIVGHSMGGLISLLAVLGTQEETMFAGIVMMGPLLELDPAVAGPFKQNLAKLLSRVLPSLAIGGIDMDQVTSDPAKKEQKRNDKLHNHGGLKARHGVVMLNTLSGLGEKFPLLTSPYLLLHGAEDKICNPEGSKRLHEASPSTDKTLTLVENGLHNLFSELDPIKSEAIATTMDWIRKRT